NFAASQANLPYFVTTRDAFAKAYATSTDPVDRVLLFASLGSKEVVVRGAREDIDAVKQMIFELDKPRAQSEISVYSVEMSSASDTGQAERVQAALRALDVELGRYSSYNDVAQTLLRNSIEDEISKVLANPDEFQNEPEKAHALQVDGVLGGSKAVSSAGVDTATMRAVLIAITPQGAKESQIELDLKWVLQQDTRVLKPFTSFPKTAMRSIRRTLEQLGYDSIPNDTVLDQLSWVVALPASLWQPLTYLDPAVLRRMNVDKAIRDRWEGLGHYLPDASHPASLAEATLDLAMLNPGLRAKVVANYHLEIGEKFNEVKNNAEQTGKKKGKRAPNSLYHDAVEYVSGNHPDCFEPNSFLGVFSNKNGADGSDVRLLQDAYLYEYALAGYGAVSDSVGSVERLAAQYSAASQAVQAREVDNKINAVDQKKDMVLRALNTKAEAALKSLFVAETSMPRAAEMVLGLQESIASPRDTAALEATLLSLQEKAQTFTPDGEKWKAEVVPLMKQVENLVTRIQLSADAGTLARYNGAIRRVIGRFYEDARTVLFNGEFGLLGSVTDLLRWSNCQVGAWSSETILASNRLAARIEPSASASVAQGGTIDALGGALMIANLVKTAGGTNIAGDLGAIQDWSKSQKREAPGVYGVGTGNIFEVTPVLDPSGQAIRFRFNYLASTQVREPSGVTDPQLNHVEHNSVNTEVMLDNLAIRRVATFQSNAQLGLPASKSGGLPIFKDLPVLKEIPLLGWFTYRIGGRKPVVQQSIILTQAAIYPTLEDLFNQVSKYKVHSVQHGQ
ncbi:MAG TPA: hypothetical protein VG944_17945, partial [Fimbriimonas sp.]|nr:hypothetical protein [Fimbriimonas sp.]